jgi:hypothetical protein
LLRFSVKLGQNESISPVTRPLNQKGDDAAR